MRLPGLSASTAARARRLVMRVLHRCRRRTAARAGRRRWSNLPRALPRVGARQTATA